MSRSGRLTRVFAVSILAVSCAGPRDAEKRLAALEVANALVASRLSITELKLSALETRLNALANYEAPLDPAERGFGIVKTNNGHLLVSYEDLAPYGDGQKVTICIGNPYNMTFHGFTVTARYGPRAPDMPNLSDSGALSQWSSAYDAWQESLRQKEQSFTEELVPGRWNRISMILSPAKAEEVGFIGIKIATDQVSLHGR